MFFYEIEKWIRAEDAVDMLSISQNFFLVLTPNENLN